MRDKLWFRAAILTVATLISVCTALLVIAAAVDVFGGKPVVIVMCVAGLFAITMIAWMSILTEPKYPPVD